jgi:hypothetical protein
MEGQRADQEAAHITQARRLSGTVFGRARAYSRYASILPHVSWVPQMPERSPSS